MSNRTRGAQEKEVLLMEEEAPHNGFPLVEGENGGAEEQSLLPEGHFEVEAIMRKRMKKGKAEYLIKWLGFPESANTWEPYEHLEGCVETLEAFERMQEGRRKSFQPFHEEKIDGRIKINHSDNRSHDDPTIIKIIRLVRADVFNDELLETFAVLRSDGKEVMADNRYLKLLYPQLLYISEGYLRQNHGK